MPGFSERVLWIFGLPGSGKTPAAAALRDFLQTEGRTALVLDGNDSHSGFAVGPEASDAERLDEVRRAAELAKTLTGQGVLVIVVLPTALENHRVLAREILGESMVLIHLDSTRVAREQQNGALPAEEIFEPPTRDVLRVSTDENSAAQTAQRILKALRVRPVRDLSASALAAGFGLRRILPEDATAQDPAVIGGAMDTPAAVVRPAPTGPDLEKNSPALREAGHPTPQTATPDRIPSRTWRGTLNVGIAADSDATASGAGEPGSSSSRRRHRRYTERRGILGSPFTLIILTVCAGVAVTWLIWLIHSSVEKKDTLDRIRTGDLTGSERVVRSIDSAPPTDTTARKPIIIRK